MTDQFLKVSAIIPVLNNVQELRIMLEALNSQTYPRHKLEIIVVDNGSDQPIDSIQNEFNVILLREEGVKSPYAARNRGLMAATGEIIAMTDANKKPGIRWIEEGVRTLVSESADLVGGNIEYIFEKKYSAAERFDSLFFNNNRNLVLSERVSVTGNLFFRREMINQLGDFPGEYRSGMDIWWTQRAVRKGYKLVFSNDAVVYCRPRKFTDVIRKSFRVGISHPLIFWDRGYSNFQILGETLRSFWPPKIEWLRRVELEKELVGFRLKIWMVAWLYKIFLGAGRVKGFLFFITQGKSDFEKRV